jgi:biopolymer transport protein ExbB
MNASLAQIFVKGGWVMWPLLIFSIVTWAVVLERAIVFLTLRPRLTRLAQSILHSVKKGDLASARQVCVNERPYVSEIFQSALDTRRTKESAERVTDRNRARLIGYMKRNLWILGTIGSASPFVGLLGTVMGIMNAFHKIGENGAGGFNNVSAGISEALIATAAGLIVAIIALLTYNIFVTAANQTLGTIKITLDEVLDFSFDKPLAS